MVEEHDLTLIAVLLVYFQIKVGAVAQARYIDDLTLQVPNIGVRTVDGHALRFFL
jgi:hypothetical protein